MSEQKTVLQTIQEATNACNSAIAYARGLKDQMLLAIVQLDNQIIELNETKAGIIASANTLGYVDTHSTGEPLPQRVRPELRGTGELPAVMS